MNSTVKSKTAQDLFKQDKEQWLKDARDTARELLKTRVAITIEDVLEVCPKPSYLHKNTVGCVLTRANFTVVGVAYAKKPSSHKRLIRQWGLTYKGER